MFLHVFTVGYLLSVVGWPFDVEQNLVLPFSFPCSPSDIVCLLDVTWTSFLTLYSFLLRPTCQPAQAITPGINSPTLSTPPVNPPTLTPPVNPPSRPVVVYRSCQPAAWKTIRCFSGHSTTLTDIDGHCNTCWQVRSIVHRSIVHQ